MLDSPITALLAIVYFVVGIYFTQRAYNSNSNSQKIWIAFFFLMPMILYYTVYTIYIVIMAIIGSDELFDDNHLLKKDKSKNKDTE